MVRYFFRTLLQPLQGKCEYRKGRAQRWPSYDGPKEYVDGTTTQTVAEALTSMTNPVRSAHCTSTLWRQFFGAVSSTSVQTNYSTLSSLISPQSSVVPYRHFHNLLSLTVLNSCKRQSCGSTMKLVWKTKRAHGRKVNHMQDAQHLLL